MSKHIPIRTCVGCFEKRSQKELVRLGEGRGAYLCPNEECFEKAMKKKSFARAFRREVSEEEINEFRQQFETALLRQGYGGRSLQNSNDGESETSRRDRNGPC